MDRLFREALDQPVEERDAYLEASGEEPSIISRVQRLLDSEESARDRIGESADRWAEETLESVGEDEAEFTAGTRLGPYEIVRELGRGGMGTVYLAERSDDRYQRSVALKVVKRGMDTREVIERFRREGRILARLEHPGIGRMYDAGVTPDGRPFLVLEYIEGEPIDVYCDGRRLPLAERIRLFLQVCDAVSFAHQKLVLHRDLKPSNILVSEDGPRLLDFGIGKLTDGTDEEDRQLTTLVGRRLTPEYASPEQLSGDPISTASDVFSLGVVLHELLTGARPDRDRPSRPSTLGTLTRDGNPSEAATARGSSAQRLTRQLRGDLDVILMKALHEDPDRRYPSVAAFGEDLQRHLNGFPVRARPDSVQYRVGKFLKRNRVPVLSGSGLGVAVMVFAVSSFLQQAQTARERDRAERARENAEQVASVLEDLFSGAGFTSRERVDTLTVRAFLDRGARKVVDELEDQPVVQATLYRLLGNAEHEMGRLDVADTLLTRSVDLLAPLDAEEPEALFDSRIALANLHVRQGLWEEAGESFAAAVQDRAGLEDSDADIGVAFHGLGMTHFNRAGLDSAALYLDTALAIQRRREEPNRMSLGASLTLRGAVEQRRGNLEAAGELADEAWRVVADEVGPDHPAAFAYEQNAAFIRYRSGDAAGAEPIFASMVDRYRAEVGETPDLATILLNHGNVLRDLGQSEPALTRVGRHSSSRKASSDRPIRNSSSRWTPWGPRWKRRADTARPPTPTGGPTRSEHRPWGGEHTSTVVLQSKWISASCTVGDLGAAEAEDRLSTLGATIAACSPPNTRRSPTSNSGWIAAETPPASEARPGSLYRSNRSRSSAGARDRSSPALGSRAPLRLGSGCIFAVGHELVQPGPGRAQSRFTVGTENPVASAISSCSMPPK